MGFLLHWRQQLGQVDKIGVPSCWELQGFGTYQYGMKFYGKPFPDGIADEKGMYKYEFTLPKEWETTTSTSCLRVR